MKTKIDVFGLSEMTVKDYQSKVKNEFKRLQSAGETTQLVVFTEFLFKCGTVGAALIIGDFSGELEKFYKETKKNRKEKDFGVGDCKFETGSKGGFLRVNLTEGAVSPSRMEKGIKKSKLKIAATISKGEEIAQVEADETEDSNSENTETTSGKIAENAEKSINLLNEIMDKIKAQFQSVRDVLPKAANNTMNPEEQKTLTFLQGLMQNWFKTFTSCPAETQQGYKEQGLKLKEQFAKIAGLLSKNNQIVEPKAENNNKIITASVGKNGENKPQDVLLVQEALNKFNAKLNPNGQFDAKTLAAIEALERAKLGSAEGLIEPNSKLWKLLSSR
jgi:hypothetical protein